MGRALVTVMAAAGLSAYVAAHAASRDLAGMSWIRLATPPSEARLVLAVPDSDEQAVALGCETGSGWVDLTLTARRDDGAAPELISGKTRRRFPGAGTENELFPGAWDLQLRLRAGDTLLQSFATTGELTVAFTRRKLKLPNAFAPAHDFLRVCRAG